MPGYGFGPSVFTCNGVRLMFEGGHLNMAVY